MNARDQLRETAAELRGHLAAFNATTGPDPIPPPDPRRVAVTARWRGLGIMRMLGQTAEDELARLQRRNAQLEEQAATARAEGERDATAHAARTHHGRLPSIMGW